jgi:hypothetical protein
MNEQSKSISGMNNKGNWATSIVPDVMECCPPHVLHGSVSVECGFTKVTGTYDSDRDLDGSAHLKSRDLSQSVLVTCCALRLSLSPRHPPTSDRHRRCWLRFGRFCAFKVTCPHKPVSFSRLLYTLSLSARHRPSFLPFSGCVPIRH